MDRVPPSRNPVVLVHGIDDTSLGFRPMRVFLEERGWAVHCVDLVPSSGALRLEALAAQLAIDVDKRLGREQTIDLVGFSMGGLVARYYLQRLAGAARTQRLITIAAPHRGSWMAYLRWNPGAQQMRPESEFLRDLHAGSGALEGVAFTSIWSPLDLMIVPATSSVTAEARNIRVPVAAHPLLVRDRRVLRLVEAALLTV